MRAGAGMAFAGVVCFGIVVGVVVVSVMSFLFGRALTL
jgi:hypothetical protein